MRALVRVLVRVLALAVVVAAAGAPAGAGGRSPNRLRMRLREDAGTSEFASNPVHRGRFRMELRGRVDVQAASTLGVRIGSLSIDVPLTQGRFAGTVRQGVIDFSVRARLARGALAATIRGNAANDQGTVLGRQVLTRLDQEDPGQSKTFHGLVAASVVLDETIVPLAVGFVGRFDPLTRRARVGEHRAGEDDVDVAIAAAAIVPVETATRPVILFVPRRPGEGWHGRARGMAMSTGTAPALSLTTSSGRERTLDVVRVPGANAGDGTPQGDGFEALVLPDGAVFQRTFDVAVQMPAGPQTVTIRASGPRGLRTELMRFVDVPEPVPPVQIDASWHVLEIRSGGQLWGWGDNSSAQIGEGTTHDPVSPVPLEAPRRVVSAATGDDFSMAADADGQVWTWGTRDIPGATIWGDPPEIVGGVSNIVAVTAGDSDSLLLGSDGRVWSLSSTRRNPRQVQGIPPMVAIAGREDGRLALDGLGNVWELRTFGVQDGDAVVPVRVNSLPQSSAISAGSDAVVIAVDGKVWTYGVDAGATPLRVVIPGRAVAVSAGYDSSLVLDADGNVWTWDAAMAAQPQSDGAGGKRIVPVRIADLDGIVRIVAGTGEKSLLVDADGAVWMWDSIFTQAGTEVPVLAPRTFHPGHFATTLIELAKRPARRR